MVVRIECSYDEVAQFTEMIEAMFERAFPSLGAENGTVCPCKFALLVPDFLRWPLRIA
jgi:hypothetical protein